MARLHLVDGTYELFRAHYSKYPSHRSPEGAERKAVIGLASSLLSLLNDPVEAPSHIAIAFDRPIRSFRNDLFPGYKSDEGIDPILYAQFEPAEEAARALGLVTWVMDTYEADDALATAAARFAGEVEQVRLMSPDKDFLQCVRGERVVRVDRMRKKITTEAVLRAERGFGPESIPDFLALVGDDADGIPGIRGFGERTASILLARFTRLEGIPRDPRAWGPDVRGALQLAETLRLAWDDALLYRRLATLVEDVPLPESLEALRHTGVPREHFRSWAERLDAQRLETRVVRFC